MAGFGTHFHESEAILAAEEEDYEELDRVLDTMNADEMERLRCAARTLDAAITARIGEG